MENEEQLCSTGCWAGSEKKTKLGLAKAFLLVRMEVIGNKEKEEFSFAYYIQCSTARDNVKHKLGCVRLQRSTDDDTGHTLLKSFCTPGGLIEGSGVVWR